MRLFRLLADAFFFVLPYFAPVPILATYLAIHLFWPQVVRLPRRLDNIDHPYNVLCRDDIARAVAKQMVS